MSDRLALGAIANGIAHVYLKHGAPLLDRKDEGEFIRELNGVEEEAYKRVKK